MPHSTPASTSSTPPTSTAAGRGSESILGRWFTAGRVRRDQVVLATKLFIPLERPAQRRGACPRCTSVTRCEASLRRLKTDHIDLYQFHHIDRDTAWEEIWEATERLVRDGKVIYVGSSNFAGWHLAAAQEAAKARHFLGLVSEQSIYNLMERTIELEVLPAAAALRHRPAALEPARRRPAGRRTDQGDRRPPRRLQRPARPWLPRAADRQAPRQPAPPTRTWPPSSTSPRPRWRSAWLLSRPRCHRTRARPPHRWSSSPGPSPPPRRRPRARDAGPARRAVPWPRFGTRGLYLVDPPAT